MITHADTLVLSVLEVSADVYLLRLEAPEIALAAKPGQFVMVRCGGDTVLPRPFSIHRVAEDSISLMFAAVGVGTRRLAGLRRGDRVDIFGPLGNGFTVPDRARNLLLVAGGLGIAPLVYLAETAVCEGRKVTIIQGARSRANLMPVSFAQSSHEKGIEPGAVHVVNVTEDGTEGLQGLATEFVPAYTAETHATFACGPLPMYRPLLAAAGDLPVQVSLEIVMGCGTGVCYGCTIRTARALKQVCKDGPVFDAHDVDWTSLRAP